MTQPSLFDDNERSIQERFERFNAAHPEVFGRLLALAFELKRKGWKRYGIRPLCERVRWHYQVDQDMKEDFKLNDHYLSRYARLIIKLHPEFDGFFELRELRS